MSVLLHKPVRVDRTGALLPIEGTLHYLSEVGVTLIVDGLGRFIPMRLIDGIEWLPKAAPADSDDAEDDGSED